MKNLNVFKKEILELNESGKTKAQIEGYLMYMKELSVNESKKIVQEVLGKSMPNSKKHEEVVTYIRHNFGKIDKQDLIKGMCEISGGKPSSMNHMYNYIRFAQEYARQEIESKVK